MIDENRFNLIDEPWLPVVDVGRVSLRDIFQNKHYRALGGNPIQKIAITKLLLAIAQAAATPEDDEAWAMLGSDGMSEKCLDYLEHWHDGFWLYGEKPFLQMPMLLELLQARSNNKNKVNTQDVENGVHPKSFGTGFYPDLPSDNNTIISECQFDRDLSSAEKVVFVTTLMNFALGGKRVEKDLINFSGQIYGNRHSAKSGPSLGNYVGYLHSFLVGCNLQSTLWMNILTKEKIQSIRYWTNGLGLPPWEITPESENCKVANGLKNSYMGCLVAMSRFVLLEGNGIYYLEGIQYPSHIEGWREPSISVNAKETKPKLIWVDPIKRPWRELTSLLSFIDSGFQNGFDCQQIRFGFLRARANDLDIGVWSGGLRVRPNAGDQSVKQDDDFVESLVHLPKQELGESWFKQLQIEMSELDQLSKIVYTSILNYFKHQNMKGDAQSGQATNIFWQLCERKFQYLVNVCDDLDEVQKLRLTFAGFAYRAYDHFASKDTARQLDAWAKNRPHLGKYLHNPNNTKEIQA